MKLSRGEPPQINPLDFFIDMYYQKVKELHTLALEARILLEKSNTEPRTDIRISPNGKTYVSLYTTCFSFTNSDFNIYTFEISKIDEVIAQAKSELAKLHELYDYAGGNDISLKRDPHTIPFVICLHDVKRVYYLHLCKNHRLKHKRKTQTVCNCYVTWEDLGKKGN